MRLCPLSYKPESCTLGWDAHGDHVYRKADGSIDEAKRDLVITEAVGDVQVRWYLGTPDLSESPIAYKDHQKIIDQIELFGLANIIAKIMPLGCIMAGEDRGRPRSL